MKSIAIAVMLSISSQAFALETRSIKVSAKGEIRVPPDELVLVLAIHTRDPKLLAAKTANDKIAAKLLSIPTKYSIPAGDVKVTEVHVRPDYGSYSNRQLIPVAYDFARAVEVHLTDFTKIEPFLSDAFDAGVNDVSRFQFRVRNQRAQQFEARRLAVMHAREKAEHLTELTGMKLGSPIRIEEGVEDNIDAGGFGGAGIAANAADAKSDRVFNFAAFQKAGEDKVDQVSAAPGQILLEARVTVEFEMLPK